MSQPASAQKTAPQTTVALCVTGSIAAFKAVEIARLLLQQGIKVLPVTTRSGARFLGHATLTGICAAVTREDMWDPSFAGELHVQLAKDADVVLVAPATADIIARMASGRADDLVAALVLGARGPVVVAPAMHPRMWAHPATQRNISTIRNDGRVTLVGPVVGPVADGEVGLGRMADPSDIVAVVVGLQQPRDLVGLHIVVTAGPTEEALDPVRFLSNRSSGKMGFALAQRAAARGARVSLVAGPVALTTPAGVDRIDVRSALQMKEAIGAILGRDQQGADALIMAAAVADYRAAEYSDLKLKRQADGHVLKLQANPDLLAEIGGARSGRRPMLVGFALETEAGDRLVDLALDKRRRKRVDLIVANTAQDALGRDTNRVAIVGEDGAELLEPMPKSDVANRILDRMRASLREART